MALCFIHVVLDVYNCMSSSACRVRVRVRVWTAWGLSWLDTYQAGYSLVAVDSRCQGANSCYWYWQCCRDVADIHAFTCDSDSRRRHCICTRRVDVMSRHSRVTRRRRKSVAVVCRCRQRVTRHCHATAGVTRCHRNVTKCRRGVVRTCRKVGSWRRRRRPHLYRVLHRWHRQVTPTHQWTNHCIPVSTQHQPNVKTKSLASLRQGLTSSLWPSDRYKNDLILLLLHPSNGLFSGTTGVSWYQKGKTSLDLNEARDDGEVASAGPYANNPHLAPDRQPHKHIIQFFTGWMFFLTPNQQCQSTEALKNALREININNNYQHLSDLDQTATN